MVQKSVFVEGFFTLRNLRSAGAAAILEVALACGIAAALVWQQVQPRIEPPPVVVDPAPVPELPTPLQHTEAEPQQPQHQDLSPVQPVPTDIPDANTLPVQAPPPPLGAQQSRPPEDMGSAFLANILRAINDQKVYPKISMLKGDTGETVVSFDYVNGVVSNIRVDKGSGFRELDQAAIQAVQRAALPPKPAELAGISHFTFIIAFDLGD